MVFDPNSAMGGVGVRPPFMGAPAPNYSLFNTGNSNVDMAFAQYMPMLMPQFFGGGKFLPQQFQMQSIMDQMASAKYQRAAQANMNAARATDQASIFNTLSGMRRAIDPNPMTALQSAQLNNSAGLINSQAFQGLAAMIMGPQNAEDLFFGRRGSAVQLANSVNQIGFYRPDSVTGGNRMSQQSLQAFSSQLYSHLYGPDADLNDISGFSAGRAGSMMAELGKRGLLPQSLGKMSAGERRQAFSGLDANALGLPGDVVDAINKNLPIDEITKIEGGADAVRKVDATRVGNSLKEYGKALSVVREIFGDNGISNAPMQQLMAAMDALTQNGGASMDAAKLENLLRRTQMASRDSGVSLEALVGLSARGGALAQQYGLSPEMAAESQIAAMEAGRALRETGGLRPGFGRLDGNKAILFAQEKNMQVDSSKAGRTAGAIARIVAENEDNQNFKGTKMRSFIAALERGDTTFYDADKGRNVDINEELGRNREQFIREMIAEAGISRGHFDSLMRDPNTQEAQLKIAGRLAGVQDVEMKDKIGQHLAFNAGLKGRIGGDLDGSQKQALSARIGRALGTSIIDDVSTVDMEPGERIAKLRRSFESAAIADVEARTGLRGDAAEKEAEKIFKAGADNIMGFKTEDDINNMLSQTMAEAGIFTKGRYGIPLTVAQEMYNSRLQAEQTQIRKTNISRAGLAGSLNLDTGSNSFQRFSDAFNDTNKPMIDVVFGAINSVEMQQKMIDAAAGGNETEKRAELARVLELPRQVFLDNTVNTAKEKNEMLAKITDDTSFLHAAEQFKGTAAEGDFAGKTRYVTSKKLAATIESQNGAAKRRALEQVYDQYDDKKTAAEIKEIFANPASTAAREAYLTLANNENAQKELEKQGFDLGISADGMSEAAVRARVMGTHAVARDQNGKLADFSRVNAFGQLGQQQHEGRVRAGSILRAFGNETIAKDEKLTERLNAYLTNEGGANIEEIVELLDKTNLSAQQKKDMRATAEVSNFINANRGFDAMGVAGFEATALGDSRMKSLREAAEKGHITGDIAEAFKAEKTAKAEKKQLDPKYKNLIEEATLAARDSDEEFKKFLDARTSIDGASGEGKSDSKAAAIKKIEEDAQKSAAEKLGTVSEVKAGADPLGLGAMLSAGLETLAESFKDLKIDKLTVASLELPKTLSSDLVTSAGEQKIEQTKPLAITGTLRIVDLNSGLLAANVTEAEQTNGASVVA
jgi:hypothetical protein